ncbi:hypothetical protein RIR_jg21610.t1 [Rhizophagus irregularis DAOM 181602=DAOM 197198]|nr:hypothetical protein RIR_jg21610.t1 [Rhizophagus irregularis DAOM 181602=DAOM 197198]
MVITGQIYYIQHRICRKNFLILSLKGNIFHINFSKFGIISKILLFRSKIKNVFLSIKNTKSNEVLRNILMKKL